MKNEQITQLVDRLRSRVSGEVRTDEYSRAFYSTDASIYQVKPQAVLIPRTVEDLQVAVEEAGRAGVPLTPRTAGSSLAGQAIGPGLVVDMSRHLDQILELNREEHWVRVQPGIVLDQLNLQLREAGLQFGPDPASSNRAAMGGIVSNNSTGSHSIVYGMTADHVLSTNVLLSDASRCHFGPVEAAAMEHMGRRHGLEGKLYREVQTLAAGNQDAILAGTPRHWRRCGGYNLDRFVDGASFKYPHDRRFNLAKLVCGSEGTLALMEDVTLNLVPLPQRTRLGIVHFEDLFTALSAVPAILRSDPSAVELLDNLGLTMCRGVPQYARLLKTFVAGAPNCVLITEYVGESEAELAAGLERLRQVLKADAIPATVIPAITPELQRNVWTVRKVGLGLMMSVKGDHKPIPFIEDAAVPVEHLAEYVTKIEQFCNDLGTNVAYYAHASAGCIHIRPLINTKDAGEVRKLPQIGAFAAELLGTYGGTLSSEHGDGRARSWLNEKFFGPQLYTLYQQVKRTFDPKDILNPGNVVNAPAMTQNLRYGESYSVAPLKEHIAFTIDQGFHRAVEMCNGAGICRKLTEGTMCPSFMVTREEEHSTRGRANALRAAMSGRLPREELYSPRMFEVMDLCVECKACKAECPSSVDMAKIKLEFLAQYYEHHRMPVRSRMFAGIGTISRISSGALAPMANALLRTRLVRGLLQALFGISAARTLPPFSSRPFTGRRRREAAQTTGKPAAVLFVDTFNTYNSPEVAEAALKVLEAIGAPSVAAEYRCCGRAALSKGLLEAARDRARAVVDLLAPHVRAGLPIVGLEPSCLLTLKDEYPSLLPDHPEAVAVAQAAVTFEEFVASRMPEGTLPGVDGTVTGPVLLHGHCHQKALVGTGPALALLKGLPGATVTEVDSGCCGMAGSFGYEREHYEVSMAMAERRLLPAVRDEWQAIVVAAGTSCRAQIKHGTGRIALHPAQVLAAAMGLASLPKQSTPEPAQPDATVSTAERG